MPDQVSQSADPMREALSILADLCGGERYCEVVLTGNAAMVVEVFSSDADGPFRVEINKDGVIRRV